MKISGIIAEYNPFHTGHLYQIRYTKETLGADYVIIAMSGDFVQRGTPALLSKHVRAEMALRSGADLVLELPVSVSAASAEFFAKGGVSLLDKLGIVDTLCFGSESGSVSALETIAEVLAEEPSNYRSSLKDHLSRGLSFPAARAEALKEYIPDSGESLTSPNNILGIEYCKALLRLHSKIKPETLKRTGADYHETCLKQEQYPSASAVRKFLTDGTNLPENSFTNLSDLIPAPALPLLVSACRDNALLSEDDFSALLHYALLMEDAKSLTRYLDVSESLAKRIINQRNNYRNFSQFADLLKTKEITRTRIQRALLHVLLRITETPAEIPYARVLGFRKDSSPLLGEIKKNSSIPLLTKLADAPGVLDEDGMKLLNENTFASNVYESLLCTKTGKAFVHEYQKNIIIR